MSLERILAVYNGMESNYDTDVFAPIIRNIESLTGLAYSGEKTREFRIVADHMRAAAFILGDGKRIAPSNTGQGYILRRLIRRAIRLVKMMGAPGEIILPIAETVISVNSHAYPELSKNREFILDRLGNEASMFDRTLEHGLKAAEKILSARGEGEGETLDGETVFRLFDTFGFPPEFTRELAAEKGVAVDMDGFRRRLAAHQELSRGAAQGLFKGGLVSGSERAARLHTATHLLNGALRAVLGDGVSQRGSNINEERLRFDFSFGRKMTEDELAAVERTVNQAISDAISVECEEMPVENAASSGAVGVFEHKYGEIVKVYTIGGYSKEICGGPHAKNTAELVSFRIVKEESSSAGVRRIKAVIG